MNSVGDVEQNKPLSSTPDSLQDLPFSQKQPGGRNHEYSNYESEELKVGLDSVNDQGPPQSLFTEITPPNKNGDSSQGHRQREAQSQLEQAREPESGRNNQQIVKDGQDVTQRSELNSENHQERMQISSKTKLGSANSAFIRVSKKKQEESKTLNEGRDKQPKLVYEEDTANALSQNINRMLMDQGPTKHQQEQISCHIKRKDSSRVWRVTKGILETFQACNPKFEYTPFQMNPRRELTYPSDGVYNNGYDNIDSDYILKVSDSITTPEGKEYEILDLMGKGTFGQVVKCECRATKELVAIKVIKNKKAFKNQGVIEIKILDIINRLYDPNGENPLLRMLDFFVFRDHLCIVCELLSASLFDLLKENNYQGLSLNISRILISQIMDAMKIVKEAKLIHCDLKPENILFKQKDMLTLKVIDFGSACFEGFAIFQYIQSRYYRSPEVLLGLPYDTAIDMWSLGCIAAELFLGIPIFPGNSEYDQLAKIFEIVGLPPQHLIQKSRQRDKYFVLCPQTMLYRFKTFEEFQLSTGIRIDIPRRYLNLGCLDDLKTLFIEKKRQLQIDAAIRAGKVIDQNFKPSILDSEMNLIDAFIDFLKGLLRIDKDSRWTPLMAKEHPFITRSYFTGPFEPHREVERSSTNDTVDDTMSEKSTSSKDSREYKVGSCPSKLLYPQPSFQPHYMQAQTNQCPQASQDFVFHGNNSSLQSYRPPVLSIPDEFFKGFMFGRLDQILSMTREQLLQFIYEQNEIAFKQQQHKHMLMQQQQLYLQQQQQLQTQQYQQQQWSGGSQYGAVPIQQQHVYGMQMPYQQQQIQQNYQGIPGQQVRGNPFAIAQSTVGVIPPSQFFNTQQAATQQQFPGMSFQSLEQQRLVQGSFQTIPENYSYSKQNYMNQQMPPNVGYNPVPPQQFIPQDQIILNPPPYMQQKQQLFMNPANLNDPQYQHIMMQQEQKRNQGFKGRGGHSGSGKNKGKAGSWHPPPGLQAHKYNQFYNQINNPGQLIGRPYQTGDQQQQVKPRKWQAQHQANNANVQSDLESSGLLFQSDVKSIGKEQGVALQTKCLSNQEANKTSDTNLEEQIVPFPYTSQIFPNFGHKQGKKSNEFTQPNQSFQEHQQYKLQMSARHQQQPMPLPYQNPQQHMGGAQFMQQPQQFDQKNQIGFSLPQQQRYSKKAFPSPKQPPHPTMMMQQNKHIMDQKIGLNSLSHSYSNQQLENQSLNTSQTSNQSHGGYLKRWEQANPKQAQSSIQGQEKQLFNQSHHYQYQKHTLGVPTGYSSNRNRSNSDQNEESKGDISFQQHESGPQHAQSFYYQDGKAPLSNLIKQQHQSFTQKDAFSTSFQKEEEDSPNSSQKSAKSGFEGLQAQIKKLALNTGNQEEPNLARGHQSSKFDQVTAKQKIAPQTSEQSTFTPSSFKKTKQGQKNKNMMKISKNKIDTAPTNPQTHNYQPSYSSSNLIVGGAPRGFEEDAPQSSGMQVVSAQRRSDTNLQNPNKPSFVHLQTQSSGRNLTPIVETGLQHEAQYRSDERSGRSSSPGDDHF